MIQVPKSAVVLETEFSSVVTHARLNWDVYDKDIETIFFE